MTIAERIRTKLEQALQPKILEITDDSSKHAGHAGALPGGETHFRLRVVSEKFEGLNRVKRHQLVYSIVDQEMKERVHALALTLLTPGEV